MFLNLLQTNNFGVGFICFPQQHLSKYFVPLYFTVVNTQRDVTYLYKINGKRGILLFPEIEIWCKNIVILIDKYFSQNLSISDQHLHL